MAGVRNKPRRGGNYEGSYLDRTGTRKWVMGTTSKKDTLAMVREKENIERQIRLGWRPAPHASVQHRSRLFEEVTAEYVAWGRLQGGLKGYPWSRDHAHKREYHLAWWRARLSLQTLADLDAILPDVERELRDLDRAGKAGKTLANYAEALTAFCDWCVTRKYLEGDPLEDFETPTMTPRIRRRAMTAEEIRHFLSTCAPHRQLAYEVAFLSGCRSNELRHLEEKHLDITACGLHLQAAWTKNREDTFQKLPVSLVQRLRESIELEEVAALYRRYPPRKKNNPNRFIPTNPLLYIPSSLSAGVDRDLRAAGIQKYALGGKLDFHCCRYAYVNLVIESGATVKESQDLSRHSTPELTMNVYARTQDDRVAKVVERAAAMIARQEEKQEKCGVSVAQQVVGSSIVNVYAVETPETSGVRPPSAPPYPPTSSLPLQGQTRTKAQHFSRLAHLLRSPSDTTLPVQGHSQDTLCHKKCGTCVAQSDDLAFLVEHWDRLHPSAKAHIRGIVERWKR